MDKRRPESIKSGFSLVELLVAVAFIGILMAGMAKVFQTSLGTFYSAGEILSSVRRNRMTMDQVYDDFNSAGMYLADLSAPPSQVSATNPAFYIIPNQPVLGAGPDDPATADEVYFYMDQPLPFEGTLLGTGNSAAQIINAGGTIAPADKTFVIECGDPSYAQQVVPGLSFIPKDSWETLYIDPANPPTIAGSQVTIKVSGSPSSGITGIGAIGAPSKFAHLTGPNGAKVVFYLPSQMVKYSIQMQNLDPSNPGRIPCLVREQGTYSSGGFAPNPALFSIITENVAGFKAYLSANSGANWAGLGLAASGFDAGWTNGIRAALNTQLQTSGRADYQTTAGNEHWFRKIATLVRFDVTTRTANKRTEFSNVPTATAYKALTQTIVFVPRHFGLPIN